MSIVTNQVKRDLHARGVIVSSKQIYAFVSITVWLIYVLIQLMSWVDIMDASTRALWASVLAQRVYDFLKKQDNSLLPEQWTNELWSKLQD